MKDHTSIEELISVRALGGLDVEGAGVLDREMAEHGPGCEECRLLEDEYAEVAGRLASALPPAQLREGFEDEVIAAATGKPVPEHAPSQPASSPSGAVELDARRAMRQRRAGARWWRAIGAVAAALVLFFGGWIVRDLTEPSDAGSGRVVAFQGDVGQLAVAYRPGEKGAYLFGADLPLPGPNQVLEVWMIQGDEITRGPCLTPGDDGSLATYVDAELGSTQTMAVTVEPSTCPAQPTTDPILTADLTSPVNA